MDLADAPPVDLPVAKQELRLSVLALSRRGLAHAAKWSAELMTQIDLLPGSEGLDSQQQQQQQQQQQHQQGFSSLSALSPPGRYAGGDPSSSSPSAVRHSHPPVLPPSESVMLAKTYLDVKEYMRAAYTLREEQADPEALFLRGYATYLAGEKQRSEEALEQPDVLGRGKVENKELKGLALELGRLEQQDRLDPFCLYLYGLVLRAMESEDAAVLMLVKSVNRYPWNWSCWKELGALCTTPDQVAALHLTDHWMRRFFLAEAYLELHQHQNDEVMTLLDGLAVDFPQSLHILAKTAMTHYSKREFDEAQELFEELRELDPHRLEHMDTYSNILYVKEARGELSFLAHKAVRNDKYRPETCCVVGNYYSLKGEHEKAVLYFKRALKLDPHYLSAWTLMGHEYVEMRNTAAAVQAYRMAVDINPRDYRAWYGLGQTYEILQMHTYSIYYFRKAATLRPYDPRMWCAMAESYERLQRPHDAIKCFLKAEGNQDREGIAVNKLARLYQKLGDDDSAEVYFRKVLAKRDQDPLAGQEGETQDSLDALVFLCERCRERGDVAGLEQHALRLLQTGGAERDLAKGWLQDAKSTVA